MKKIFLLFIILYFLQFFSCAVISIETYKSADTLGPLHFRVGTGGQFGFLSYASLSEDSLKNLGLSFPLVNLFGGLGITKKMDIYASLSFPFNPIFGFGVKYQFFDKLGLKMATLPNFKYNYQKDVKVFDTNITYLTTGLELPIILTYSFFNIIFLTTGIQTGYYKYFSNENNLSYDFLTYGINFMPEIKFKIMRFSFGFELMFYKSFKYKIVYDEDLKFYQKHFNPFINISLQF